MNIESLKLVVDINRDGSYSLWEIWEAVKFMYRVPGNLMVEGLGHLPYVPDVLGIEASTANGYESLNGLLAISLSLLFWMVVIFAVLTLSSPEADDEPQPAELAQRDAGKTGERAAVLNSRPTGASAQTKVHLPVSRKSYAISGRKPHKRRPAHHWIHNLIRHAK